MKNLVIVLVLFTSLVYSHGGGLDSNGGHYNRKTGEYHIHRKPKSKPVSKDRKKNVTHTVNQNSGIRHNSSCRYFNCYNCYPADSTAGVRACKVCGG